jgi:hypothetical protein
VLQTREALAVLACELSSHTSINVGKWWLFGLAVFVAMSTKQTEKILNLWTCKSLRFQGLIGATLFTIGYSIDILEMMM